MKLLVQIVRLLIFNHDVLPFSRETDQFDL